MTSRSSDVAGVTLTRLLGTAVVLATGSVVLHLVVLGDPLFTEYLVVTMVAGAVVADVRWLVVADLLGACGLLAATALAGGGGLWVDACLGLALSTVLAPRPPAPRPDLRALFRSLRPETLLRASAGLGRLEGRAAVVWSRRDPFFTPRDGRRLAALLGTQVRWTERARAFVPWDRPDAVAAAIGDVLGRVAAGVRWK